MEVSFGPAEVGGFWEESPDNPASLIADYLGQKLLKDLGDDREDTLALAEQRRMERRKAMWAGFGYEFEPKFEPALNEGRKVAFTEVSHSARSESRKWRYAFDDDGNAYITNHYTVKQTLPQYAWLEAPGDGEAGRVIAPRRRPTTARDGSQHGGGGSNVYPWAGELLKQDPTNMWCIPKSPMRRLKSARAMLQIGSAADGAHDSGTDDDDEISSGMMPTLALDSCGFEVRRGEVPRCMRTPWRQGNAGQSSFAMEREAKRLQETLRVISESLKYELIGDVITSLAAELLSEEYVLTVFEIQHEIQHEMGSANSSTGLPANGSTELPAESEEESKDESAKHEPYATFSLMGYKG